VSVLQTEHPLPGVRLLTLNRPQKRNALSTELLEALIRELGETASDDATRCVVLTGAGPSFCAGGDMEEMRHATDTTLATYLERYRALALAVRGLGKPLLCALHGHAVAGGFELACLCDIRIVATDCAMRVGDVDVGLSPTSGLTWILPRLIGLGRAHYLALLSPSLDGPAAVAIGLADEHVAASEVLSRALGVAAALAAKPGRGVALTREGFARAGETSFAIALQWELEAERLCFEASQVRAAMAERLR
jgi:2-(1,2-epoxy-1,2-dihydrophenyl)acetyl-CoA isomerase